MDTWVWIVIAAAVVVVLALVVWGMTRRHRTHHLQGRFGPEYDRTVDGADSRRAAEHDLRDREHQRDAIELRPLSVAARDRYQAQWTDVQTRFVDRPSVATGEADELITDLMRERGYPVDDFEARSGLVSVDHPDVVEHYRFAHEVSRRNVEGRADTEDLRRALIAYRSLFDELLIAEPSMQ
jgi:hypothetical protein